MIRVLIVSILLLLASCKPKNYKVVKKPTQKQRQEQTETDRNLDDVENYQRDTFYFETLMVKADVSYNFGENQGSYTFNLRIKKDSIIWLSAPLGLAKMRLTPQRIQFYSKLEGTYYDANYQELSSWLGIKLDFKGFQNILLGGIAVDVYDRQAEFISAKMDKDSYIKYRQFINYITGVIIYNDESNRVIEQTYKKPLLASSIDLKYQYENDKKYPRHINIVSDKSGISNTVDIDYRDFVENQDIKFVYQVPEGYTQIFFQ